MTFSGQDAGVLRQALRENLVEQPGLMVIDADEIKRASNTLGGRPDNSEYPRLASLLKARAFVHGTISRQHRGWMLTIRVRRGADGVVLGQAVWQGRTLRALKNVRRNGYAKLAGFLTRAFQTAPTPQMPAHSLGSDASVGGAWWQTPPATKANWWQRENDTRAKRGGQDYHALRLTVLGGIQYRSMNATILSTFTDNRPLQQRSYDSNLPGHTEFGVEAEFYPFAIPHLPYFPYVGLVGSFRHSLFLNGEACTVLSVPGGPCSPAQTRKMDVEEWEFYGALRGRVRPFGHTQYDPEFQAEVGLGSLNFLFDLQQLVSLSAINPAAVIPPFRYKYVHLGLGGSYGLIPEWLTVALRTGYRIGLGVGTDALNIWGTGGPQGPDKPSGFIVELEGRSEAPYILPGLYFGLRLSYFYFRTRFSGQPSCADATDGCTAGEPWPPWPEEDGRKGGLLKPVMDHYFRAALMIGYTWPSAIVIN